MHRVAPLLFPSILLLLSALIACPSSTGTGSDGATATPSPSPSPTDAGFFRVELDPLNSITEEGAELEVTGTVYSSETGPVTLRLLSDVDGQVRIDNLAQPGPLTLTTDALTPGWHTLTLEADQRGRSDSAEARAAICAFPPLIDFSAAPAAGDWELFRDAYWDSNGWIELTGTAQGQAGGIFKVDRRISAGNFSVEFKIATGGGINTGADGFAVSVINAADTTELINIVNSASTGGCLGYGTVGPCGSTPIEAFHIEFDTWFNNDGNVQDPTSQNHIAVNINGDASGHALWADVPSLEDLAWRQIRIDITGTLIQVYVDGTLLLDGTIPDYEFKGGYIGATGSTGWASNFHRMDDLQLLDRCVIPD